MSSLCAWNNSSGVNEPDCEPTLRKCNAVAATRGRSDPGSECDKPINQMVATFFKHSSNNDYLRRVSELGWQCQEYATSQISDLSEESWRSVYIVTWKVTQDPELWPEIRKKLALANRFFIVCGHRLESGDLVRCMKDGAFDVAEDADSENRWISALQGAADAQKLWIQLYGGRTSNSDEILIGRSPEIVSLRQNIQQLGPTDATVLIMGESGAGKEKVAEALHKAAGSRELVAVNCAAIPKDLIEAELFGSEKGAFTGAQARKGLVEQADNGTLFLDEIGELDHSLQPKLLRFLETRIFRRVGGNKDFKVNLRVIAATNRELDREIARGRFRGDLYFRLSEITLKIPPLRLRKTDIPIFAKLFMERANERFGKNFEMIEPELIQKLQMHQWPGNVRELKSTMDRLVLMNFGTTIRSKWWEVPENHLSGMGNMDDGHNTWDDMAFASHAGHNYPTGGVMVPSQPYRQPTQSQHYPSQKERMVKARELLDHNDANLSLISAQLGIHPTTLYRWRKQGKV